MLMLITGAIDIIEPQTLRHFIDYVETLRELRHWHYADVRCRRHYITRHYYWCYAIDDIIHCENTPMTLRRLSLRAIIDIRDDISLLCSHAVVFHEIFSRHWWLHFRWLRRLFRNISWRHFDEFLHISPDTRAADVENRNITEIDWWVYDAMTTFSMMTSFSSRTIIAEPLTFFFDETSTFLHRLRLSKHLVTPSLEMTFFIMMM